MSATAKEWIKNIGELVLVAILTYLIFTYIVKPVSIEGHSMMPSINDADLAIVDTIGLRQNGVKRFDVVIIDCDRLQERLIKRVIGLPNETIEYKNDRLYVDGRYIAEPFLDKQYMKDTIAESGLTRFTSDFKITLKDNEYFVMGDNRPHSEDSRAVGTFGREDFIGKNGFIIFPFSHFGYLNQQQ